MLPRDEIYEYNDDEYYEDEEDEEEYAETIANKKTFFEKGYEFTKYVANEMKSVWQEALLLRRGVVSIDYVLRYTIYSSPVIQYYAYADLHGKAPDHYWIDAVISKCLQVCANTLGEGDGDEEDEDQRSMTELSVMTAMKELFQTMMQLSQKGSVNRDVALMVLSFLDVCGSLTYEGFSYDAMSESDVNEMFTLVSSWLSLYQKMHSKHVPVSATISSQVTATHERSVWELQNMEMCLLKILILQKRLAIYLDLWNLNDDIDGEVYQQADNILQQVKGIPFATILKQFQKLQGLHVKTHVFPLSADSHTRNLDQLSAYLFWVERVLEVAILRLEAVDNIDACRLNLQDIRSHRDIIYPRLSILNWIQDKCLSVITEHTYIHSMFVHSNTTSDYVLTWLYQEVGSQELLAKCRADQQTAVDDIRGIANEWDIECKRILEKQMQQEIVEEMDTNNDVKYVLGLFF
jgi:hypothetical protein